MISAWFLAIVLGRQRRSTFHHRISRPPGRPRHQKPSSQRPKIFIDIPEPAPKTTVRSRLSIAARRRTTQTAMHIIDVLIAERAPKLSGSVALAAGQAAALRPAGLRQGPGHGRRRGAPSTARRRCDYVSEPARPEGRGLRAGAHPGDGPVILVCNHPTGIADGIALYDALKPRPARPRSSSPTPTPCASRRAWARSSSRSSGWRPSAPARRPASP